MTFFKKNMLNKKIHQLKVIGPIKYYNCDIRSIFTQLNLKNL